MWQENSQPGPRLRPWVFSATLPNWRREGWQCQNVKATSASWRRLSWSLFPICQTYDSTTPPRKRNTDDRKRSIYWWNNEIATIRRRCSDYDNKNDKKKLRSNPKTSGTRRNWINRRNWAQAGCQERLLVQAWNWATSRHLARTNCREQRTLSKTNRNPQTGGTCTFATTPQHVRRLNERVFNRRWKVKRLILISRDKDDSNTPSTCRSLSCSRKC